MSSWSLGGVNFFLWKHFFAFYFHLYENISMLFNIPYSRVYDSSLNQVTLLQYSFSVIKGCIIHLVVYSSRVWFLVIDDDVVSHLVVCSCEIFSIGLVVMLYMWFTWYLLVMYKYLCVFGVLYYWSLWSTISCMITSVSLDVSLRGALLGSIICGFDSSTLKSDFRWDSFESIMCPLQGVAY